MRSSTNNTFAEFLLQSPAAAPPALLQVMLRTGLPQEFIERHLEYIECQLRKPDFDAATFHRTSSVYAAWMAQHPIYTAAVSGVPLWRRVVRQQVRSLVDTLRQICARRL